MRVVSTDPMAAFGSADLALVGVDVRFGHQRKLPAFHFAVPVPVPVPAVPVPDPVIPATDDHDVAVDTETSCAEDLDGCRLSADVFVLHGRIVLPDRIMFDFNQARVRSRGREAIGHITDAWHAHPDWQHITIEGHADVRGSDDYNQWLSQLRAERAREQLLRHGFAADMVDAIGYGRTRPRDPGTDEGAHANNRRVEFVIITAQPQKATP
jgi:outer membrane protein OmpA-like peptidoglycan-associated protein